MSTATHASAKQASRTGAAWAEQNQARLVREFVLLRRRLSDQSAEALLADWPSDAMDFPPALDVLAETFGLSRFERELLLLLAGVEMESELAELCAQLAAQPRRGLVTFGLGMSVLAEPHWSALAPTAPLRRFRLIEMESGPGFTSAPLRIDERILHYLAGVNRIDSRLDRILRQKDEPRFLTEEHRRVTAQIATHIAAPDKTTRAALQPGAVLQLFGDDPAAQENIAAWIAHRSGRRLFVLRMEDIPSDLDQFIGLWTREAMLSARVSAARLGLRHAHRARAPTDQPAARPAHPSEPPARRDSPPRRPIRHAIRGQQGRSRGAAPHLARRAGPGGGGHERSHRSGRRGVPPRRRDHPRFGRVSRPGRIGRRARDQRRLLASVEHLPRPRAPSSQLARPAHRSLRKLERPGFAAFANADAPAACIAVAQPHDRLRALGIWRRERPRTGNHRIVCRSQRHRKDHGGRNPGTRAEARSLSHRPQPVVSKYIGETEKNLRRIFDAAEEGGALLLFDEADALFGQRTEVKDSHDRYANIEVSYLLQRMETFRGLAILTTNSKTSLDKAFERRLRFTVDFPFPGAGERQAIWRHILPPQVPTEGLDPAQLANLNMSGGSIRNIALNAAFMAAEADSPVRMGHILAAVQLESAKIERPISETEIRGWAQNQAPDAKASPLRSQSGGRP